MVKVIELLIVFLKRRWGGARRPSCEIQVTTPFCSSCKWSWMLQCTQGGRLTEGGHATVAASVSRHQADVGLIIVLIHSPVKSVVPSARLGENAIWIESVR